MRRPAHSRHRRAGSAAAVTTPKAGPPRLGQNRWGRSEERIAGRGARRRFCSPAAPAAGTGRRWGTSLRPPISHRHPHSLRHCAHWNIHSGSDSGQPSCDTEAYLGEAYLSREAGRLEVLACTNSACTACGVGGGARGDAGGCHGSTPHSWPPRPPAGLLPMGTWHIPLPPPVHAQPPTPPTHLCAVAQVARQVARVVAQRGGPVRLAQHEQRDGDAGGGHHGGQVVEHAVLHQRQLRQVRAQELKGHVQRDLACADSGARKRRGWQQGREAGLQGGRL